MTLFCQIALALGLITSPPQDDQPCVIVVVGVAGVDEYAEPFNTWADRWAAAANQGNARLIRIGAAREDSITDDVAYDVTDNVANSPAELSAAAAAQDKPSDRELLRQAIEQQAAVSTAPLWIVMIGHGTFDGSAARFNMVGPDVTPGEMSTWLEAVSRPLVVINCASASSPFLTELSGENRVLVSATRSGHELNYTRFGDFLSAAIIDPTADLDKDEQVSVLEAFLTASKRVEEFYVTEARLATEHALMDDNGDKLGTPADWFRGVRATKRAKDGAALDGVRAHQLHLVKSEWELSLPAEFGARRDEIELSVAALREEKANMQEAAYYNRLEQLMLELAELYKSLPADG